MTLLLIVGGSDTGRAPLAAALLRRRLADQASHVTVESAGILGHDGSPLQSQAQVALEHMGLPAVEHTARLLTAELAQPAILLLAVDRGIARATATHYPDLPVYALPELANAPHDIPDPFRMTLDAWIIYGRELDAQIGAALPALLGYLQPAGQAGAASPPAPAPAPAAAPAPGAPASDRLRFLIGGIAGIPELIDWARARAALRETIQAIGSQSAGRDPGDLRPGAAAMLLGMLGSGDGPLTAAQMALLEQAAGLLAAPLDGAGLGELAGLVGRWGRGG